MALPPLLADRADSRQIAAYRAMAGAERLRVAYGLWESARRMLTSYLAAEHPDWSRERVVREAARRLSLGSG